jgi:Putative prokaryotic signal transducing protein
MDVLLQTNDPVLLSYVECLLADAGIAAIVFDRNISVMEGSIGVFPRRVMVAAADLGPARQVLWEAGLADHLSRPSAPGVT